MLVGCLISHLRPIIHILILVKEVEKKNIVSNLVNSEIVNIDSTLKTRGHLYTFLNPVSFLQAIKHKDLFEQFDGIFADGSLLVKAIRLLYGKKITRRSFDMTSIGADLFNYSVKEGKSVYIVSSEQKSVEKAIVMGILMMMRKGTKRYVRLFR